MGILVFWIVSALTTAWAMISGVAGIAGAAALGSALAMLPARLGSAPTAWLDVANYYLPVNECVTLFVTYCTMASFIKVAKWTAILKK